MFPFVPSEATSECLKAEWRATHAFEFGGILSIQWTAMLAGLIEKLTHLVPDSKPIVAARYDGFSPCLPLLALFFLSTPSFYFDCLMSSEMLDQAHKQMGTVAFNASMHALDYSTDASKFRQAGQQSNTCSRFESRALASTISAYHDDPNTLEAQAYVPWPVCMDRAQYRKNTRLIWPRTSTTSDQSVSGSSFLEVVPLNPNSSFADSEAEPSDSRFERFHNATYDIVRNALASLRA
jgi:hypothetical protein